MDLNFSVTPLCGRHATSAKTPAEPGARWWFVWPLRFPGLDGQLQFANVYVDGEDIRTLDDLETPVREGATVILLPAMAGGACG